MQQWWQQIEFIIEKNKCDSEVGFSTEYLCKVTYNNYLLTRKFQHI